MSRSRYLALLGRTRAIPADIRERFERTAAKLGLVRLLVRPRILVAADRACPRQLLGREAVAIGSVFRSDRAPAAPGAPPAFEPADLLRELWGSFVLFAGGEQPFAARDPSGTFPCYRAGSAEVDAYASDGRILHAAGMLGGGIDWSTLVELLAFPDMRSSRTALAGCTELLPGTATLYGPSIRHELSWSPARMARYRCGDSRSAAERVREAVISSTGRLAGSHAHILLELSGGLDSSILAAALHRSGIPFSCATLTSGAADDDERAFARAVADCFGVPLVELVQSSDEVSYASSMAADLPRPCTRAFSQPGDALLAEAADHLGCDAFMSGGGGDNVFCLLGTASPVADRLLQTRSIGAAWRSARDSAEILRQAPIGVAFSAARIALRRAASPAPDLRLLSADAAAAIRTDERHPWLTDAARCPPGKREHIRAIVAIQNHVEGFARARRRPLLFPLLSAPVLEACLPVASWMWTEGGMNRAVARRAFAADLPPSVVRRRTKGGLATFAASLLRRHQEEIRSLLLEGKLARQGLLDLPAIETLLDAPLRAEAGPYRLLELADIEAWAAAWGDAPAGLTAAAAHPSGDTAPPWPDPRPVRPEASN